MYPMTRAELPMRLTVGMGSGYHAPPMLLQEVWVSETQFQAGAEPERVCDARGVCDALDDDRPPDDNAVNLVRPRLRVFLFSLLQVSVCVFPCSRANGIVCAHFDCSHSNSDRSPADVSTDSQRRRRACYQGR